MISQTPQPPCRDHQHKNNQPIPTITAKDRTNTNENKKKQPTPTTKSQLKTRPPTAKSPPKTGTNPPKTLAEIVTNVFSTIAKYNDGDTAEYVSETLSENPCDDNTREMARGIIKEAKTPKFAAYVCDHLFKILDVIKKEEKRRRKSKNKRPNQKQDTQQKQKPHQKRKPHRH